MLGVLFLCIGQAGALKNVKEGSSRLRRKALPCCVGCLCEMLKCLRFFDLLVSRNLTVEDCSGDE